MKIGGNRTITDLFLENVERVPEQPFIRFAGTDFTYGNIGHQSARLSAILAESGIGARSRVALAITNRPAFMVAFLAILSRGATVIPLNTLYKPDEVRYALEHAGCRAVVTEKALVQTIREGCGKLNREVAVLVAGDADEAAFDLENAGAGAETRRGRTERPAPGDLAGVFYTSGTTARPKGVMISHENMLYSAEVTIKSLGIDQDDVPLLAFPLFHVNSLFYGILTAIVLQGAIGLVRGFSVSSYWSDAVQAGATWTPGITGPLVRLLLQQDQAGRPRRTTPCGLPSVAGLRALTRFGLSGSVSASP